MSTTEFQEGPGWSPDGGKFWRKNGKIYWEDGDITDDGVMMREMIYSIPRSEWNNYENFSEWSDEKRIEVCAETRKRRDAQKSRSENYRKRIDAMCRRARKKLTRAEYRAVFDSGYHEGTYWP